MEDFDIEEDGALVQQPRGRQTRPREPVDQLTGHMYLQFPANSHAHSHCERLRTMPTASGFEVNRTFFEDIDAWERLSSIFREDTPWYSMLEAWREMVYRLITIEFMSSFSYMPAGNDDDGDPVEAQVRFRLCGNWHHFRLSHFAVLCGFYTEAQVLTFRYLDALDTMPRHELVPFWDFLTDHRHHFGATNAPVGHIRDPLYRVVHHLIARSIVPRERARDKVNHSDLFHLFCILTGRDCNLAASLAMYMSTIPRRQQRSIIYGGSFVTVIARNLGYLGNPLLGEGVGPSTFGRPNLLSMHILRNFVGLGERLVSHRLDQIPFVPEPIPPVEQIPLYEELNNGIPNPDRPVPQPRHPPHPIIEEPGVLPPPH